jgi:excisionase family DNA binding protein
MSAADLLARWRVHAETLRAFGAAGQAEAIERCAAELETFTQRQDQEPLTLREAAELSGYSGDHLRRLVRDGALRASRNGRRLRFRAADLPQKPKGFDGHPSPQYDPYADARQVIARRSHGGGLP